MGKSEFLQKQQELASLIKEARKFAVELKKAEDDRKYSEGIKANEALEEFSMDEVKSHNAKCVEAGTNLCKLENLASGLLWMSENVRTLETENL